MTDFWQNPELEPKRAYRFVLRVAGTTSFGIQQFLISKVSKPSFSISESEHKYLNHSFYYPGKLTWNDVSFTIVDVLGGADGTNAVVNLLKKSGYSLPGNASDTANLATISKEKSTDALGQVQIVQLDADGEEREIWILNNAWIKDAKFGDLDYGAEDMLNVEVTLKYDNASLRSSGGKSDSALRDVLK
jgi:hypothetical protein